MAELLFRLEILESLQNSESMPYTSEDIKAFRSECTMQIIPCDVTPKKCRRLEELQEGVVLILKGIGKTLFRNKKRYILQFDDLDGYYLSNYWFEKEMEKNPDFDYKFKHKLQLDKIKATPTRKPERNVFFQ